MSTIFMFARVPTLLSFLSPRLLHDFCSATIRGHALYVLDGKADSFVTMEANETGTAEIWASVGAALRVSGKFVAASTRNKDSRGGGGGVGGGVDGGTGLPAEVFTFIVRSPN